MRKYYPYDKWEAYQAGMYSDEFELKSDEAKLLFADFFRDLKRFDRWISYVFDNWPKSCEQFLLNKDINRIAWIGQAACCAAYKIPRKFRTGFYLLSKQEQQKANRLADQRLKQWLKEYSNTKGTGSEKDIQKESQTKLHLK